ncbi:MAG: hypothetical protein K2O34_08085 [Acetatifactor sp.]|nr:hypothetical protein [Acetatifactor sp.]
MSITVCGRQEVTDNVSTEIGMETSDAAMEDRMEVSSADHEDEAEISSAGAEDETEMSPATEDSTESSPVYVSISVKVQADLGMEPLDIKLTEAIEENVILSSDTEIEACEWVDEEKSCLRIRVQYKEPPPDNYQHKEDYFFFLEGEDIQPLYVDYPTKDHDNIREDRYVRDACDFEAHLEDVTFDGQEDLIIFLGYSGSHAAPVHGAYVYEDGSYRYKSGFEDIPDYKVDAEEQFIRGFSVECAMYEEDYIFKYRDGEFVKVSYHLHEIGFDGY